MADSSVAKDTGTDIKQKLETTELLFNCAQEMGLHPSWVRPKGLFAISLNGRERYISSAQSSLLNSEGSASLARNKYATRLILERNNMQNIPFARPRTHIEAEIFLRRHGKIIAKPVRGAGSRDINIITNMAQLQALQITKYILEKYIEGNEVRYLILNDKVIGVHRSDYGVSVEATRPLQRISYIQDDWDDRLISASVQIANVLDLRFAAVDYLIDSSGQAHVLEVNTDPGLKWFHAPTSGPVIDVARYLLEAMVRSHPGITQA